MRISFKIFLFILILGTQTFDVEAKLKVVTTIPEFAWIYQEIGGDQVEALSLLNGDEDPHYVDAVPNFILEVSRADVLCFVGLELEMGWLPKVISSAGNPKVRKGQPGYCDMSQNLEIIEKIDTPIDRSMGHLHAEGNPHYWLSAEIMIALTENASARLSALIPSQKDGFESRSKGLVRKIAKLRSEKRRIFEAFKDRKVIQYHSEFSYLLKDLNLDRLSYTIEEKPGVSPSAAALAKISERVKKENISLGLASPSAPSNKIKAFERLSGTNVLSLPTMSTSGNFIQLYEELTNELYQHLSRSQQNDPN